MCMWPIVRNTISTLYFSLLYAIVTQRKAAWSSNSVDRVTVAAITSLAVFTPEGH